MTDGKPQENEIKDALAGLIVSLVRLKGRRHAAHLFQAMAVAIDRGELGGPVEPQIDPHSPVAH